MTLDERMEKMRRQTEIALEAAHIYTYQVWVEGEAEDARLLVGLLPSTDAGINFDEWIEHHSFPGGTPRQLARWYIWRMGYTHATREQPEDYYDVEITKTTVDSDAVVALVLDLVRQNIDNALQLEGEAEMHNVPPLTPEQQFTYRMQYLGHHLKQVSEYLLALVRRQHHDPARDPARR